MSGVTTTPSDGPQDMHLVRMGTAGSCVDPLLLAALLLLVTAASSNFPPSVIATIDVAASQGRKLQTFAQGMSAYDIGVMRAPSTCTNCLPGPMTGVSMMYVASPYSFLRVAHFATSACFIELTLLVARGDTIMLCILLAPMSSHTHMCVCVCIQTSPKD